MEHLQHHARQGDRRRGRGHPRPRAPVRFATFSASRLPGSRTSHRLARNAILEIAAHLMPGNRLPGGDDFGVALLSDGIEVTAPFFLIRLLRNSLQDETV